MLSGHCAISGFDKILNISRVGTVEELIFC